VLLAARFSFKTDAMPEKPDSPSTVLGAKLSAALDRSLLRSLNSLAALRSAVRNYTIHERNRGVSLEALVKQALTVLDEAEDGGRDGVESELKPDLELTRKLEIWCREAFAQDA